VTWDSLPPRPWPEAVEPPVDQLADWLLSLSREEFEWVLDQQRASWRRDSDCFMRDHDGRIRHLESRLLNILTVCQLHGVLPDGVVPEVEAAK
jgi:hypothetical protein